MHKHMIHEIQQYNTITLVTINSRNLQRRWFTKDCEEGYVLSIDPPTLRNSPTVLLTSRSAFMTS